MASPEEQRKRKRVSEAGESAAETKRHEKKMRRKLEKESKKSRENNSVKAPTPMEGVETTKLNGHALKNEPSASKTVANKPLTNGSPRKLKIKNETRNSMKEATTVGEDRQQRKKERRRLKMKDRLANALQDEDASAVDEELVADVIAFSKKWELAEDDELLKMLAQYRERQVVLGRDDGASELKLSTQDQWQMSKPLAGRLVGSDPIFSRDGSYLILATVFSVLVYEVISSKLMRSIDLREITCIAPSNAHEHVVYVGHASGKITKVNWATGKRMKTYPSLSAYPISQLAAMKISGTDEDGIFTASSIPEEQARRMKDLVSTITFRAPPYSQESSRVLFTPRAGAKWLQVLDNGRVITFATDLYVTIGTTGQILSANIGVDNWADSIKWTTFKSNDTVHSLKMSVGNPSVPGRRKRTADDDEIYDLALGLGNGEIHVHRDIGRTVEHLVRGRNVHPEILSWHQYAPKAIKWTWDGNYLISGGDENVLKIWQRETGTDVSIPRLGSAICNIALSPEGSQYAVSFVDNRTVVVSTAENEPVTKVVGLQAFAPVGVKSRIAAYMRKLQWTEDRQEEAQQEAQREQASYGRINRQTDARVYALKNRVLDVAEELKSVRKKEANPAYTFQQYAEVPIASHPRIPGRIMLAAPGGLCKMGANGTLATPYLQIFDVQNGQHLTRQAITRNVMEVTSDADYNIIEAPSVLKVAFSCDGEWMATLEEWVAPPTVLKHIAWNEPEMRKERARRVESFLKIWRWNEDSKDWELNTRVDRPHQDSVDELATRALDLVAHPTQVAFTTIGEDGLARTWTPVAYSDQNNQADIWEHNIQAPPKTVWASHQQVPVARPTLPPTITADSDTKQVPEGYEARLKLRKAAGDFELPRPKPVSLLAYSSDSSVLAVGVQDESLTFDCEEGQRDTPAPVYFFSGATGDLHTSEASLVSGPLLRMAFLDKYLIVISRYLVVWDTVNWAPAFTRQLWTDDSGIREADIRRRVTHLAVDEATGSFALTGWHIVNGSEKPQNVLQVYNPSQGSQPVLEHVLDTGAWQAVIQNAAGGFTAIDSRARLFKLLPPTSTSTNDTSTTSHPAITATASDSGSDSDSEPDLVDDGQLLGDDLDITIGEATDVLEEAPTLGDDALGKAFGEGAGLSVGQMFGNLTRALGEKRRRR